MLFSPVYIEPQPRQSLVPGLAPVSSCHPLPFNFLRIRTEHPARCACPPWRANPERVRRGGRAEGSSFPSNPFRIRTSKPLLPQPLYNPHLRSPLGCAGNKRLTGAKIHRQLFCNQHLQTTPQRYENTATLSPVFAALSRPLVLSPLYSALTKTGGWGEGSCLTFPPMMYPVSSFPTGLETHTRQRFAGTLRREGQ
jgi:hypothetical protein